MTLRKYLAGLALLFALPGVVLLVLGNGLAWAFLILGGFLLAGSFGADLPPEYWFRYEDHFPSVDPTNPANPEYIGFRDEDR